jgi:hypothetical protein
LSVASFSYQILVTAQALNTERHRFIDFVCHIFWHWMEMQFYACFMRLICESVARLFTTEQLQILMDAIDDQAHVEISNFMMLASKNIIFLIYLLSVNCQHR